MLAVLLNVPRTEQDWATFSLHHRESHDAIRRAIQKKTGVLPPSYPIEPINLADMKTFLQRNAQLHSDMNGATGQKSDNLQDTDLTDQRVLVAWIYNHWQEHRDAETALGIGS